MYEVPLPQGTRIRFRSKNYINGTGVICGVCGIGQAVIGRTLIVEIHTLFDGKGDPIQHEYTHMPVFEYDIEELLPTG